jgi:hypothetical protein
MKLYYFPVKARAETARVILKVSGVKFDDVVITGQEFGEKYKAMSPSGQVCVLEIIVATTCTTIKCRLLCACFEAHVTIALCRLQKKKCRARWNDMELVM